MKHHEDEFHSKNGYGAIKVHIQGYLEFDTFS